MMVYLRDNQAVRLIYQTTRPPYILPVPNRFLNVIHTPPRDVQYLDDPY